MKANGTSFLDFREDRGSVPSDDQTLRIWTRRPCGSTGDGILLKGVSDGGVEKTS